jgi:hypothetical protein
MKYQADEVSDNDVQGRDFLVWNQRFKDMMINDWMLIYQTTRRCFTE